MSPSIGHIVLFRPQNPGDKDHYPAVITHVWSATCVNLFVFTDGTVPVPLAITNTSVTLHDEDTGDGFSCWWPPRVG